MKQSGVTLIVVAYVLLFYTAVTAPPYAKAHPHLGVALLSEYAAPWPVTLTCVLAGIGVILAVVPIRRGERWAIWTSAASLVALLATRLWTDPRCALAVVSDPHQHGCHTFMITMVVGLIGLAIARFG
jgi:hypothetical protein